MVSKDSFFYCEFVESLNCGYEFFTLKQPGLERFQFWSLKFMTGDCNFKCESENKSKQDCQPSKVFQHAHLTGNTQVRNLPTGAKNLIIIRGNRASR